MAQTTPGLVGQVIGRRYEIRRLLGEGGMGQVYLAEQIKMRRLCALKLMHAEQMHDADAAGRFGREAYNASRIINPHVAAIYDFGETDDGRLYIAMEYVEGPTLSELLRREQRLPIPRAVAIAEQIADALGAAHELNIIHRDLKPDNVMLTTSRAGRDVVKVVDFGIAKAVQLEGQQITRTGFIVGTPAYMSPEQVTGEPLDPRSDLYALGCILFKMLTGTEPFTGQGQATLMRRLSEPPPDPRSLNPEISAPLAGVIVQSLARLASERYPNADAFGEALARAAALAPATPGVVPSFWTRFQSKWSKGGRRSDASPGRAPISGEGVRVATPHSPALARPSVQWPGAAPVTPDQAHGGGSAPASAGVAVADGERSPAAPWRIRVEPTAAAGAEHSAAPLPVPRPERSLRVWAGVATGIVLVGGATFLMRPGRATPPDAQSRTSAQANVIRVPDGGTASPGTHAPNTSDSLRSGLPVRSNPPDSVAEATSARAAALRRFHNSEAAALRARDLAVGAGAIPSELAPGETLRARADSLVGAGEYATAAGVVGQAAEDWKAATRTAQARAAAHAAGPAVASGTETPHPPVAESTASRPITPPVVSSGSPAGNGGSPAAGGGTPPAVGGTGSPAAAAGNADVPSVLAAYVAAVNTRQMAEMRRIWPTMPDDAAHSWQALFAAATDLNVTLVSVEPASVNGTRAQTTFSYTMKGFVPSQGPIPPATLRFKVKLERDAWGWRIVSMDRQK